MEDPYLRERENDVADVAGRLRMNLRHGARGPRELLSQIDGPSVLIADELTASVAAQLDWSRVQGFATDAGSRTYHTAILARSLKVPAIVGLHDASLHIAAGTPVILDGTTGELLVAPPPEVIEEAQRRAARPKRRGTASIATGPITTRDGVRIRLEANIELLSQTLVGQSGLQKAPLLSFQRPDFQQRHFLAVDDKGFLAYGEIVAFVIGDPFGGAPQPDRLIVGFPGEGIDGGNDHFSDVGPLERGTG